jgi:hypothetical protein
MAFDNRYPNRKDHRRSYEYNYAKSVDRSCRNHGGCKWCVSNRRISWIRRLLKAQDMLNTEL